MKIRKQISVAFLVILLISCISSCNTPRIGAVCNDGTYSNATGRGACSHHGGVNHWVYDLDK